MKRILTLIVLILISIFSYSQIDYPRYEQDSLGQKVVVITIEQAQKLDNNSDLLILFEKLNTQINDYDSVCVKVINEKEKVILSQKMEILKLKESINNKDKQIITLQGEIESYMKKTSILEAQVSNRQLVIDTKDRQIKSLKTKMVLGGIGSGIIIIGLVILLL